MVVSSSITSDLTLTVCTLKVTEPIVVEFFCLNAFMLTIGIPCCFFPELVPKICLEVFSYGKSSDTSRLSKIVKAIQVPKRWFSHFYLFGALYSGLVLGILIFHTFSGPYAIDTSVLIFYVRVFTNRELSLVSPALGAFVAAMFTIHLLRRLYESLFINIFSEAKMNVVHYLSGMLHYFGTITSLLVYSVDLMRVEGSRTFFDFEEPFSIFVGALATLLFAAASYVQYQSNLILVSLRKEKDGKEKYPIPMGGAFYYVSCPHFFCEIIIYLSLYMILGVHHYIWGFITSWVFLNQVMAGWMSHQWYLKHKKDYPRRRKAIIPYIL